MNDYQLNGAPILLWQTGLKEGKKLLAKEEFCWNHWPNSGIVATSPMVSSPIMPKKELRS